MCCHICFVALTSASISNSRHHFMQTGWVNECHQNRVYYLFVNVHIEGFITLWLFSIVCKSIFSLVVHIYLHLDIGTYIICYSTLSAPSALELLLDLGVSSLE